MIASILGAEWCPHRGKGNRIRAERPMHSKDAGYDSCNNEPTCLDECVVTKKKFR